MTDKKSLFSSGYLQIIIASLIWGSLGVFIRQIDLPVPQIVFFRTTIAVLTLMLIFLFRQDFSLMKIKSHRILLISTGFILTINWLSFFYSVKLTTVANAVLITYTAPVLVVIMAFLILKEEKESGTISSLILALVGLMLIIWPDLQVTSRSSSVGIIMALISSLTYAILVIAGKVMIKKISSLTLVFYQSLIVSLILSPVIIIYPLNIKILDIALLIILGSIHSCLAVIIYLQGLRKVKAQHAGILTYLDPISAAFYSAFLLGDKLTIFTILGGFFIVLAGANLVWRKKLKPAIIPE